MLTAAVNWVRAFRDGAAPRWLTYLGTSGSGKTHLCKRLWEHAKKESDWSRCEYIPQVVYWPQFVQELRAGKAWERRSDMQRWPVLFLDDIGAERDASGFAAEELHTLLGCRMGRWTLVTANTTMPKLASLDQRIASRVIRDNNVLVQVQTEDFSLRAL